MRQHPKTLHLRTSIRRRTWLKAAHFALVWKRFGELQSGPYDGAISTATQILAPTFGGALRILDDGTWKVDPNYARSVEVSRLIR